MPNYHSKMLPATALLLAVFTSACSICPLADIPGLRGPWATSKHFDNQEISFDFPQDWRTLAEFWRDYQPQHDRFLDAEEIAGVADPGSSTPFEKYLNSVRIVKRALPPGSDLVSIFAETDPQAEREISEGTLIVDGLTAYERSYERFHGEPLRRISDIWLEKEGTIYIISCWSTPGRFDQTLADFNLIIESFHVK